MNIYLLNILLFLSLPLVAESLPLDAKIFVAGHKGLVGSAIVRALEQRGHKNLITKTSHELDLRNQAAVNDFFAREKPEFVFLGAAKVGGILANATYPVDFIYDNLMIEANVLQAAHTYGVKKLLFLGSSCIYPRDCPQPIREEYLLTSALEPSNQWYAIAKIAGLKMCQAYKQQYGDRFIACMPTNLYGPNDNFHPKNSHVLPALIRRFIEAKEENRAEVVVWGTGNVYREFLHVDDLANACLFLMENYEGDEVVNVGTGKDVTIRQLVELVAEVVDYKGAIVFDASKPDGTPRKMLNVDRLHSMGWTYKIELTEGVAKTIKWYLQHRDVIRN